MEKETGRVEITDIEADVFKKLLLFIYRGKIETNDTEELLELILAADKYSMKSLVDTCAFKISCNLTADNAVDILIAADMVRAEFLKKDCINLIVEETGEVYDTKAFKKLRQSHTYLVCQIFDTVVENSLQYDPLNRVIDDFSMLDFLDD